jgi:hypothetical protein
MRASPSHPPEGTDGHPREVPAPALRALVGIVAVLVVASALAVSPAGERPAGAQGCGPVLTVSKSHGLDPNGETVTVSGACFDEQKGIYVAFCVVPPPGSPPSPCGGGVATEGSGGLSHWISSNPPPYAVGLTTPYGPGGSFTVTLRPSVMLNPDVDCRVVQCAIATRNDHTRSSDRGQDGIVPVSFAAGPPSAPPPAPEASPASPPPETVPETTTTEAPPETTTTTTTSDPEVVEDDTELASAAGESGGSAAGWVVAMVIALLVVAAATGVVLRRRRSLDGPG